MNELSFVHRFVPGANADSPVLLLLHGTGGTEADLIPLGRQLSGAAALLSVRGKVLENGLPRFFRRFAEGVFDVEDLKFRTDELADFLSAARERYGLRTNPIIAVGYSNGANIAASLLLSHPRQLAAAILFRAMVPYQPDTLPQLNGTPILLSSGQRDPIVPPASTRALAEIVKASGAEVSLEWSTGGHELARRDVESAKAWLERLAINSE